MYNERSGPGSCGNRVQLVQGLSSVHNSSNTHRPLSLGVPTTPIPRFIHDSLCRTYRSSSEHLVLRRSNLKSASDVPKASNFHVALVTRRINNSKPHHQGTIRDVDEHARCHSLRKTPNCKWFSQLLSADEVLEGTATKHSTDHCT